MPLSGTLLQPSKKKLEKSLWRIRGNARNNGPEMLTPRRSYIVGDIVFIRMVSATRTLI
jgi:hypothetical protein